MVNINMLRAAAARNGLTLTQLAQLIGINYSSFYRKIKGESEFKLSEIATIDKICKLNRTELTRIFFNR